MIFLGDPILPGVEQQSENSSLYLHPGETELSHHRDQLQTVCTAGGRRRTDLSTQQHIGGGICLEIHLHYRLSAEQLRKTTEDNSHWPSTVVLSFCFKARTACSEEFSK